MSINKDISCAILAGGKSKRFNGIQKALIPWKEKPLLEHYLDRLQPLFDDLFVISNDSSAFSEYKDLEIYPDVVQDKGPLGGIHAALTNAKLNSVFVLACDMPLLNNEIIESQIEVFNKTRSQVVVPRHTKGIEPLHSIWDTAILDSLDSHLKKAENLKIRTFIEMLDHHFWEIEGLFSVDRNFININSIKDLDEAQNRF